MYPVTSFPDNKGGKNKKEISSNKLKKGIPVISNNARDKRQAYTQ